MEPLKVSEEALQDYCSSYDENEKENVPSVKNYTPKRLIKGIDLKDLCDGKEIVFEMSKDNEKNFLDHEEPEFFDDIIHQDSKSMRENRGAPPLDCDFESIAEKMVNVTENGLVKKQLITNGIGKTVPDNAYVTVHYNMYKEHCELPFDSTYLRERPEKFRLDQGETIEGLEYAIKSMKKHENSRFFIKWEYAFGEMGCPDRIEEKCDIIADITLINFVEFSVEENLGDMSQEDINKVDFYKALNQAKRLHVDGSDEFEKGDSQGAVKCFKNAVKILNGLRLADEEQESLMLKQKVKCLVNMALCYNKLGKHEQACLACQEVLAIDCNNVKAYFHYGRANVALSNFPVAQKLLFKANKLKPNDKDINKELKKLDEKKSLYEMKDKIFWRKAFENDEVKVEQPKETPPKLVNFEESLRTSLEKCTKEKKPYILPVPLLYEEKELCERIASSMNFNFKTEKGISIFEYKKDK